MSTRRSMREVLETLLYWHDRDGIDESWWGEARDVVARDADIDKLRRTAASAYLSLPDSALGLSYPDVDAKMRLWAAAEEGRTTTMADNPNRSE